MEQADGDKMDRKTGSAPGFLRHVEAAELKDVEETPASAGETAAEAAAEAAPRLAGGIVTRLTPPPPMSGDLLADATALTARQKSRVARERAGSLPATRYIALMLIVGIVVGAAIGTMVAMSLFP